MTIEIITSKKKQKWNIVLKTTVLTVIFFSVAALIMPHTPYIDDDRSKNEFTKNAKIPSIHPPKMNTRIVPPTPIMNTIMSIGIMKSLISMSQKNRFLLSSLFISIING